MRNKLVVGFSMALCLIAAVAIAAPSALASRKAKNQVVEGEILFADPVQGGAKQCDGWGLGSDKETGPVREALDDGLIGVHFDIDPSTRGEAFVLEVVEGSEGNLDVIFMWPGEVSWYQTVRPGGERGLVPPKAQSAYICLAEGSRVGFRYEAGVSVAPPPIVDEADLALHSPNLDLLAHLKTQAGIRRMVFQGDQAVASTQRGISIYRLLDREPYIEELSTYRCRGGSASADISIWGDYVFQSIADEFPYQPHSAEEMNRDRSKVCNNTDDSHEKGGIRVIDISDPRRPTQVNFFELACGSMNHTLVPDARRLYIYAPTPCHEDFKMPSQVGDLDPRLRAFRLPTFQIKVLRFDPRNPERDYAVRAPTLDDPTDLSHPGMQFGCHDITVFPAKDLAACPQFFNEAARTSLLNISDPVNPRVIAHLPVPAESTWMSYAAFTWDGNYVLLSDTGRARYSLLPFLSQCAQGQEQAAGLWIYDISEPKDPHMVSEFSLPRQGTDANNPCTPWEINMIPTRDPDQHTAVVGWNTGGMTVIDFRQPAIPRELAHWQPQPASQIMGSYFYNGLIYSLEYWTGGVRVFEVEGFGPKTTKSYAVRMNPQTQLIEFRN